MYCTRSRCSRIAVILDIRLGLQGDEVIAEIFKTTGGPGGGAAVKDPLGRGYVNPASLTLVSGQDGNLLARIVALLQR